MPKIPRISTREAIQGLERLGFEQVRQTGSHVVMKKETEEGKMGCVVPIHRELKVKAEIQMKRTNQIEEVFNLLPGKMLDELEVLNHTAFSRNDRCPMYPNSYFSHSCRSL